MEAKLSKIYYSPRGYWKGLTAVKKLASAAKVSEDVAKQWLAKPCGKYTSQHHATSRDPSLMYLYPMRCIKLTFYSYPMTNSRGGGRFINTP